MNSRGFGTGYLGMRAQAWGLQAYGGVLVAVRFHLSTGKLCGPGRWSEGPRHAWALNLVR